MTGLSAKYVLLKEALIVGDNVHTTLGGKNKSNKAFSMDKEISEGTLIKKFDAAKKYLDHARGTMITEVLDLLLTLLQWDALYLTYSNIMSPVRQRKRLNLDRDG